jgi:proline iminopeptidase
MEVTMTNLDRRIHLGLLSITVMIFVLFGCGGKKSILSIGESKLPVPGGKIWYKVSGSGTALPVVLIHGGPGMSSFYFKPFEELGNDRQVIRYDQLGGGKSDKITDTTLFTIDHFVKELDLLRDHLGIEKWNVLGHSWGTVVALEYYRAYPDRVSSLVFGSLCFDVPGWSQSTRKLLKSLPDSLQDAVKIAESTGKYDDPAYQNAMNQFYSLFVFRNPVQADLDSMFATYNFEIYSYMWGPSEFTINGTLKDYNPVSFLPQIKVPTMFTVGEFDEIDPTIVKELSDKVPGAKYVMFPNSGHMTPWDARDQNIKVVREFLNSIDSR